MPSKAMFSIVPTVVTCICQRPEAENKNAVSTCSNLGEDPWILHAPCFVALYLRLGSLVVGTVRETWLYWLQYLVLGIRVLGIGHSCTFHARIADALLVSVSTFKLSSAGRTYLFLSPCYGYVKLCLTSSSCRSKCSIFASAIFSRLLQSPKLYDPGIGLSC